MPLHLPATARPLPTRLWLGACALLLLVAALPAEAARLALVVGNDRYQHVTPLRNARNDAQSFSKELQAAGFQVTTVLDGTREQMHDQIDGFLRRIEKGDEVVFFFSGHGSQPPQLGPYLLPVDIKVTGERAIQRDGLSLEQLVDDLNQRARFSLIIVDACRDDPFRATTAGRSLPPGSSLSRIEPPKGSMIIMAASKGQQALDRLGDSDPVPNGLFTRELIKQMRNVGVSAAEMLKRVRSSVETKASAVNHQQRPSLVDESSTDFFFYPPKPGSAVATPGPVQPALVPAAALAPATQPMPRQGGAPEAAAPAPAATPAAVTPANALQAEFELWDRAANSKRREDYEAYLRAFPKGRYAERVREALKQLP